MLLADTGLLFILTGSAELTKPLNAFNHLGMHQRTDGLVAMTLAFQANNSGSNPDRCTYFIKREQNSAVPYPGFYKVPAS